MRQTIIFLIASCLIAVLPHAAFAQSIDNIDFEEECEIGRLDSSSTTRTRIALAQGHCRGWALSIIAIDDGDYETPMWLEHVMEIEKHSARNHIRDACQHYKASGYSTRDLLQAYPNGICRSAVKAYDDYAGCWLWISFEVISTNLAASKFSDPCKWSFFHTMMGFW